MIEGHVEVVLAQGVKDLLPYSFVRGGVKSAKEVPQLELQRFGLGLLCTTDELFETRLVLRSFDTTASSELVYEVEVVEGH